MFIVSGSNAANIREKQIDSPIQKIWISGKLSKDLRSSTNPVADIVTELNKCTISLQRQTNNGSDPILLPIGLGSLAEICSNNESHLNLKYDTVDTKVFFELSFDVSHNGALESKQGSFILLDLILVGSTVETMDVYGIDSPIITQSYIKYEQHKASGNAPKTISLIGVDTISLPRTNFQQIELVFADRTVTYKSEIKAITQAIENLCANYVAIKNDVPAMFQSVFSQSYYDGIQYHTISVSNVLEARILYSADANIITSQTV